MRGNHKLTCAKGIDIVYHFNVKKVYFDGYVLAAVTASTYIHDTHSAETQNRNCELQHEISTKADSS